MNEHFFNHHVIGIVKTNCYIFGDPKEAIMFDPGGERAVDIAKELKEKEIEIKHVIATHGHFDHLGWAGPVQELIEGSKVYLHEGEKKAYEPFLDSMERYGLERQELREVDVWLSDNQVIDLGGYKFRVIHTPGHSPGSATFQLVDLPSDLSEHLPLDIQKTAFVGDTIFQGSVGRVDLPYSDKSDMVNSLNRLIDEINPNTHLYPGHGSDTIMKNELSNNPYLRALQNNIPIF